MADSRIEQALARIDAAMTRVEAARDSVATGGSTASPEHDGANSTRVMALINNHERLREEVADTIRDLDTLIDELGG